MAPDPSRDCDVAIVGAGVAGLAAMRALEEGGLRTCVVEARNRIGGRIFTLRDARLAHPIELGAEFVHGSAPEVFEVIREARLLACAVEGERWRARGTVKRLTRIDAYWMRLHSVLRHVDRRERDRSFADFLEEAPGGRSAVDARRLARSFVEGFHGADPRRISARWLAEGGSPGDDAEEQRIGRIADGYDRVPEWLARDFHDRIMTDAVVERIDWESGRVNVSLRRRGATSLTTLAARAAIVTVPLGVLLAPAGEQGAITFSPSLPIIDQTRDRLTMGSVVRVTFLFRERWWTDALSSTPRGASLGSLSFLHGDVGDLPIWWSLHPVLVPAMVGWVGGPKASQLAERPFEEIQDRAVSALAANLGVSHRRVASQVVACWAHDWQSDPHSRGAYSHALVGGADWATRLARPIQRTLWLAGEAAASDGRTGTVHGAMGSGRRAARAVARALA